MTMTNAESIIKEQNTLKTMERFNTQHANVTYIGKFVSVWLCILIVKCKSPGITITNSDCKQM